MRAAALVRVVLLALLGLSFVSCSRDLEPGILRAGGDWTPPPAYHGNPFGFGSVGVASHIVFEPLFSYIPQTEEWLPRLAERFEDEGRATTVHLRPNAHWHDEQPVTAEDVRSSFLIMALRGHPVGKFCRQIEVLDDHTIKFHWRYLSADLKPMIFAEPVLFPARQFPEPASIIEEFLAGEYTLETDAPQPLQDRLQAARQELLRFRPGIPIGTGPFRMTKVTASEMVFEKFKLHPLSEQLKFDGLRVFRVSSNEVGWALLLSGQIDFMAMSCPIDLTAEIQKRNPQIQVALPLDGTEAGFILNSRRLPLPVRQALPLVLDRQIITEIAFPYSDPVDDRGLGVIASRREKWLNPENLDKFAPRAHDLEEAERLLLDADYQKDDQGRWLSPEGAPLSLTITCRAGYTDFVLMSEVAASQWESFGIPTQIRVAQPDIYPSLLSDGNFEITANFGVLHGRFSTPSSGLQRFYYPGNEIQKGMGLPKKVVLEGQEIDTEELILGLPSEENPEALRHKIFLLGLLLHREAVYIPIFEKRLPMFASQGPVAINWPAPNHPYWSGVVSGAEQTYLNMLLFAGVERAEQR